MSVSDILRAGGKIGFWKKVVRDNLGPLGFRYAQIIHRNKALELGRGQRLEI